MIPPSSCRSYLLHVLLVLLLRPIHLRASEVISGTDQLVYNGFSGADLNIGGRALLVDELLSLTNIPAGTSGHALCSYPLSFRKFPAGPVRSFSTTFVFAIGFKRYRGHGLAFMLSSTNELPDSSPRQYLGLPNSDGHVFFAVELDTVLSPELNDIDGNHVGVDVDGLVSVDSHTAGFYDSGGQFQSLELRSGIPMQVWVDYDSQSCHLNVTLAPCRTPKPSRPLLSTTVDLSSVLSSSSVYAGFSAAGEGVTSSHYVLGWSLKLDGDAQPLDYSVLPTTPEARLARRSRQQIPTPLTTMGAPSIVSAVVILSLLVLICWRLSRTREDAAWELECRIPSFTYKELLVATESFSDRMLLGKGGFGRVYRGVLPTSRQSVAVKRVSPESKQGKKEFMAEIAILGNVRHRNLVQLLGYCRHKQELLLVYDYMPNGSLDKYLHDSNKSALDWAHRLHIIRGVASGLFYLHEDWKRVIVHRDIKTSNVLLDDGMNGRLGDFGLARLHDHGADAHTTRVAGTLGYIAPELARLGKATKATDVFAFGVFIMEVVCGRRPVAMASAGGEPLTLADWVISTWQSGSIVGAVDPKLGEFNQEEVELVLKLGLLCSHPSPKARPCMRVSMLYLQGGARLPDLRPDSLRIDPGKEDQELDHASCPSADMTITILTRGR